MSVSARRAVLEPIKWERAEHAGLWLDKYLKNQDRKATGDDDNRDTARHQLMAEATRIALPAGYDKFFAQWESALSGLNGRIIRCYAPALGRIIIGLGGESPSETAITLHHTFGVPYLPGSALKGLSAFYARNYLDHQDWRLGANNKPGNAYQKLFGDTTRAGSVTYYDAYYVPSSADRNRMLHTDTITVHHQEYYQGKNVAPADWDKPIPVPFISATGIYLVALGGAEPEWVEAGLTILGMALEELGIGAKTSSGYGRMALAESLQEAKATQKRGVTAAAGMVSAGGSGAAAVPTTGRATPAPAADRQRGTVADVKTTYAFIEPEAGGKRLFVHQNNLREKTWPLHKGQRVEYAIGPGKKPKEMQAVDLIVIG